MSTAALQRCVLCGAVATYVITTGTETVAACAAELVTFIDAGLDSMGEPFVVVRRAQGRADDRPIRVKDTSKFPPRERT